MGTVSHATGPCTATFGRTARKRLLSSPTMVLRSTSANQSLAIRPVRSTRHRRRHCCMQRVGITSKLCLFAQVHVPAATAPSVATHAATALRCDRCCSITSRGASTNRACAIGSNSTIRYSPTTIRAHVLSACPPLLESDSRTDWPS